MKLKLCEIVQQLEYIKIDDVEKVLNSKDCIRDYAYIVHDKDVDDKGNIKAPHIHLAIRFNNAYDTKHIAQWFDVKENYVSKVKGKWSDMLKYLTHDNAPGKYQYNKEDVVSNFDFEEVIKNGSKKVDLRKEEIINQIVEGVIREYNYHEYISPIEYNKYNRAINDSFKYRTDKIMNNGECRKMECVFITGSTGTGKTTYAKKIADDKGYSYFVSSSTNDILDGYKGQDVIILDDLRNYSMHLVDLLKLLDNNTSSTVKSRFKNKFIECKMIIITTVFDIEHFYQNLEGSIDEPIQQFKRRCKTYVRLDNENMYIRGFDTNIMDYGKTYKLKNPVWEYISVSRRTEEEMLVDMIQVLGIDLENIK